MTAWPALRRDRLALTGPVWIKASLSGGRKQGARPSTRPVGSCLGEQGKDELHPGPAPNPPGFPSPSPGPDSTFGEMLILTSRSGPGTPAGLGSWLPLVLPWNMLWTGWEMMRRTSHSHRKHQRTVLEPGGVSRPKPQVHARPGHQPGPTRVFMSS